MIDTTPITTDDLTEHSEYSIICDICDDESTREYPATAALRYAIEEGFVCCCDTFYCKRCFAELQEDQ